MNCCPIIVDSVVGGFFLLMIQYTTITNTSTVTISTDIPATNDVPMIMGKVPSTDYTIYMYERILSMTTHDIPDGIMLR
jgi:hypothetical protein